MDIKLETPNQPEVVALIDLLDAYQLSLYPPESVYALDMNSLLQPNVLFAVARNLDGAAVGCGAIVVTPGYGEVKRMFVHPSARGQGVAQRLLGMLETEALARGCRQFMLETGPSQPEAIGLYQRLGYRVRGPYGDYRDDPLSVFMEKAA
ncbi:GNAT family N-acetyltransferase [Duganella sp. Root1480D1]|uniref:GNAT family N-acetyltransferase n=1 Tax=Duganella sp. Root1480D1 TaxID=1736471 RepID=UPI00071065F0|nr:GNAT family N-acetyltransferase [Duganella sp. Root1480D1]KQZ27586.1 GCN5 family acetyltransferase [Duganella sp. Root1480D1]